MLYREALFCYSHQGDKRQQSHASSCSPLLLRLCAGFLLCWSVDGLQRWPQSPSDKRERKQRGIGITSFRWPSTEREKKERRRGEKDSERLRHIILLSLKVRAGLSMYGCGGWGHALTAQPYLLSPVKDIVGLDSARFNQGRVWHLKLRQ